MTGPTPLAIIRPMSHRLGARAGVAALILLHLALGTRYARAVPAWEAPDEPWHLVYAEVLARGRSPTAADTYQHHHPPLFYVWTALGLRLLGAPPEVPRAPDNPRAPFDLAAYLHPPDDPGTPWLRLLRLWAGLATALLVPLAWCVARRGLGNARGSRAWDGAPFLAALLIATLPQLLFIGHSISNDGLVAAWGALACYGMLRWVQRVGLGNRRGDLAALLCMGLGLGFGLWTKLTILGLLPAVALALALGARVDARGAGRGAAGRRLLVGIGGILLVMGLVLLAIPLLWPAAGASLLDGLRAHGLAWREELVSADYLRSGLRRILESFFGRFGWMNLRLPASVLALAGLWALLGLAGLPRAYREAPDRTRYGLLVAAAALAGVLVAALRNLLADPQAQGRFLFPALAAIAFLLASGWRAWLSGRWWRPWLGLTALAMVALNLWVTARLFPGAYAESRRAEPRVETRFLVLDPVIAARLGAPGDRVSQSFGVEGPGFRAIEVPLAGAGGSGTLRGRLLDAEGRVLAETEVSLAALGPNAWLRVALPPAAGPVPGGRTYQLELSLSEGPGHALFWGSAEDRYAGGTLEGDGVEGADLLLLTVLDGAVED